MAQIPLVLMSLSHCPSVNTLSTHSSVAPQNNANNNNANQQQEPSFNFLIDSDLGCDDAATLAFALSNQNTTKVCAISTVFGNVTQTQALVNASLLTSIFGHPEIAIYPGAKSPITPIFSPQWNGHGPLGQGIYDNWEDDVFAAQQYYYNNQQQQQQMQQQQKNTYIISTSEGTSNIDNSNDNTSNCSPTPIPPPPPTKKFTMNANLIGRTLDNIGDAPEKDQHAFTEALARGYYVPQDVSEYPGVRIHVQPTDDGNNDAKRDITSQNNNDLIPYASTQLVKMVNEKPGFYDLLCLAPLTNIAHAIRLDGDFLSKLKSFVWLGGALDKGNSTKYAEFNAFSDSGAAKIVFDALSKIKTSNFPLSDNIENNNENNNNNNGSTPLIALGVSWEASESSTISLSNYKRIFATPLAPLKQRQVQNEQQQQQSGIAAIFQNAILNRQNTSCMSQVLPYVIRQFASCYEDIVQTAIDSGKDTIENMHQHLDSYCTAALSGEEGVENKVHIAAEDDVGQASINLCDMLTFHLFLQPNLMREVEFKYFTFLSDSKSQYNGQLITFEPSSSQTQDDNNNSAITPSINNQEDIVYYPTHYLRSIDCEKYQAILQNWMDKMRA